MRRRHHHPPITLLLLVLLLGSLHLLISQALFAVAGGEKNHGVCISPGGRFPRFLNEGKPPRKVMTGPRDLTLCRVFRQNTCCDVAQTLPAFMSIRRLASTGEANQECLQLWEMLECSICDPHVGVQPGPPVVCSTFCDRLYEACSDAYFSNDAKTQVLEPCGLKDFVCGRASEWISNGTDLCRVAGFSVKPSDDPQELSCYGGKASLDRTSGFWKASESSTTSDGDGAGTIENFKQWVNAMKFNERVSWAVGGMVLTAGLIFVSRRERHRRRQKQAAFRGTARKLGTKIKSRSTAD